MLLNRKLPLPLCDSPLTQMESDSDIAAICDALLSLSDAYFGNEKKIVSHLLMACLGYLRDWCHPSQQTMENLTVLLKAAQMKDGESPLDNLFSEMQSDCKKKSTSQESTPAWEPSALKRKDGLTPRDTNGIDATEDFSLSQYLLFRQKRGTLPKGFLTPLLTVLEKEIQDAR